MAKKKTRTLSSKISTTKGKKPVHAGFLASGLAPAKADDYVIVELKHNSQVAYSASGFEGPDSVASKLSSLNKVLEGHPVKSFGAHLGASRNQVRARVAAAPGDLTTPVTSEFATSGFVRVVPKNSEDCADLVRRLNRVDAVWKAVVAPKPVPAAAPDGSSTTSRNFEPAQGYLHSAPNGIGAMDVWDVPGAKGKGVRICDIEGNWQLKHEDLPSGIPLLGGTVINDIGWRNHGTAVLGEMVAKPGISGCAGISHEARAAVHSAIVGGVFNTAAAILNASSKLGKGDVILIELQATGPRGRYVAMQYWDDVFSAIRTATAKGITVVEAAGNGNENFDLAVYAGTGLQKDSGAIVVGAGIPPTNFFDFHAAGGFNSYEKIGTPRSRIWFSNYGKILNVQAWGWHVTTLGYGDAQGGNEKRWYTLRFSGTSSASPIVTGAVACVQGRAKAVHGSPMTPADVRKLLIKTGTPQAAPLSKRIGPQPNLAKAIRKI